MKIPRIYRIRVRSADLVNNQAFFNIPNAVGEYGEMSIESFSMSIDGASTFATTPILAVNLSIPEFTTVSDDTTDRNKKNLVFSFPTRTAADNAANSIDIFPSDGPHVRLPDNFTLENRLLTFNLSNSAYETLIANAWTLVMRFTFYEKSNKYK